MPDQPTPVRPSRFGPVVLTGLVCAGLGAVAAAKPWFSAAVDAGSNPGLRAQDTRADMPAALALALVVLAAWGVVLVTRTTGRRIALTIAGLAVLGVIASVVLAAGSLPDQVRERIGPGAGSVKVSMTAWYPLTAVAAVLGLVAVLVGWRLAPRWPSMSARYDAPEALGSVIADQTDLWKALDAGQDPTEREEPGESSDSPDPGAPSSAGAP